MPLASPYSTKDDLLLGDLMVSSRVDLDKFVADAADEIDGKLGFIYALPLDIEPSGDLPVHEQKLLKQINNKLASGRVILTLDIAGEGTSLHAYGLRLITEAMNDLMLIANGTVDLSAVKAPLPGGDIRDMAAGIINHDEESGVEMFEFAVMRPEGSYWNPGEVTTRSVI